MASPITSPDTSKTNTQGQSRYPPADRAPAMIATTGPSITASGRISADPCAIRKLVNSGNSHISEGLRWLACGSQPLVTDVGAICGGKPQTCPCSGPVIPDNSIEGAAEISAGRCDCAAGWEPHRRRAACDFVGP